MFKTKKGTGALLDNRPSEEKQKDYLWKEIVANPEPVNWQEKSQWRKFPIYDQNGSSSCVAFSLAKILGIMHQVNEGEWIDFSPGFIYQQRSNKPSAGMAGIDAWEIVRKNGALLESFFPSQGKDDHYFDTYPVKNYEKEIASVFKISNYVILPTKDIDTIASTIQKTNKGVMVWYYWTYDEWDRDLPIIKDYSLDSTSACRHSVVAVDYILTNGKKCLIIDDSWGCFDKGTEILTKEGWKFFKDIKDDEIVATLNLRNLKLEYQKIQEKQIYDYDGLLWNYKARNIDLLVTPNHRLLIKTLRSDWQLIEADKLWIKTFEMKKDADWDGEEKEFFILGDYKIKMDDWLEFLGYYISEGSCSGWQIQIAAKKEDVKEKIRENLKKLPFHFSENKNDFSITSGIILERNKKGQFNKSKFNIIVNYLKSIGKSYQKYIPDEYKNLSKRQLKILFDALMLGDGSYSKCFVRNKYQTEKVTYYTSSKKLADDIQEIALKIGCCGDVSFTDRRGRDLSKNGHKNITRHIEYRVGIKRFSKTIQPKNGWLPKFIPYKGKVYCVTVPNGTIYVRRNGKAVWSGNSNRGADGQRIITEDFHSKRNFFAAYPINFKFEELCMPKPSYTFNKDLSYGMNNNDVKMLQCCLKFEGLFPVNTECTGSFYGLTLSAVKQFQAKYGIPQTGYVGQITRAKLNELF